jgi:hypothetical protein
VGRTLDRPFRDSAGKRGNPERPTSVTVKECKKDKNKSIRFRLINPNSIELLFPDSKPVKVTSLNALKLAYWILDNCQPTYKRSLPQRGPESS